uniref:ABC transporter domain-containing protein n=1 Tax=Angiostrongylus cantonensis TaxID=6313 RepID=A0A0K0CT14_ANGCA
MEFCLFGAHHAYSGQKRSLGSFSALILPSSGSRFQRCCSYVSGRQRYPSYTTVRSFLFYTAAIKFGCSFSLDKLMREFDLLEYCDEKLKDLSADVRRRALIAVALVKDPVLLVAEDPCHGLEPIACFHLMQCLHSYAAENNRIVLTSLMSPRSDICEMISGLTILFRGRVFYSGHIKNLPNYFRRVGLVCPDNENPAMYYCEFEFVRYVHERASNYDSNYLRRQNKIHALSHVKHMDIFLSSRSQAIDWLSVNSSSTSWTSESQLGLIFIKYGISGTICALCIQQWKFHVDA